MNRYVWLNSLKPGDHVMVVDSGISENDKRLDSVSRVTKTQVTVGGIRYLRSSGHKVGSMNGYWGSHYIDEVDQELIDKYAEKKEHKRAYKKLTQNIELAANNLNSKQLSEINVFISETLSASSER